MARFAFNDAKFQAHHVALGVRLPGGVPVPTRFKIRGRGDAVLVVDAPPGGFLDGTDLGVDVTDPQMIKAAEATPWFDRR